MSQSVVQHRTSFFILDGPIRTNRFADSRESSDSRESVQGSRTEALVCKSHLGGLKITNCRFEATRANRLHVMKTGFFFFANRFARINLREFALRIAGPDKVFGQKQLFSQRLLGRPD